MEMKNQTAELTQEAVSKDYNEKFVPAVHRLGRGTMLCAIFLSFLPVAYLIMVKGFGYSFAAYLQVTIALTAINLGSWITEPIAYWPALGSAGTYISYLSGNVGGMRFPVALSVQASMGADINTPRGQVATVVGIVASVFSNLVILLVIILAGDWLLGILPQAVLDAFAYIMPSLIGATLLMTVNGEEGVTKGFFHCLPYLVTAIAAQLILMYVPFLAPFAAYGAILSVGAPVLVAYILYRVRCKKEEQNEAEES